MTMLSPGAVIGILGGGQLGRMLALAAAELGFDTHIFTPETDSPASRVAAHTTLAAYEDEAALAAFAKACDVVTYEFENVPARSVETLIAAGAPVRPGARALEVAQDRLVEKQFLLDYGIPVAPHADVSADSDLESALAKVGAPAILKTRRFGYDGHGQARGANLTELRAAFRDQLKGAPAILEGVCAFEREASIIAARGADGALSFFDLCENKHARGILAVTRCPAEVNDATAIEAQRAARTILTALDYVGVLTIEFFVMKGGALIANEIAPRVHNSGHWTAEACLTSQFEQHIRAVAGWPLGPTDRMADIEMINLLGDDVENWRALAADPNARIHLYGKRDARPGRKMGHVTRLKARNV